MDHFKLLIDTHIVIGLEDPKPVEARLAEISRLSNEYGVGLFVEGANYDDIARDRDEGRRRVTLSKLDKFQKLAHLPNQSDADLVARFGPINKDNDRSDARLLAALDARAVDYLISEDGNLHKRAARVGLGDRVLAVDDALQWLKLTFVAKTVELPHVIERKAYELSERDPIFASLREDYPPFDGWFERCKQAHRDCWVLEIDTEIAGLIIRKTETHAEAQTQHRGPKILKICTFKVRDEYLGEKFGELLLKQALWFAQHNNYGLVYLTVYPKHALLIALLRYYGFSETKRSATGELVMEKPILRGALPTLTGSALDFARANYPRFHDGVAVSKFYVPIQPDYHRRLFPEIAFGRELPLFPTSDFGPILTREKDRTPGNTIRKVYLCNARTTMIRPGDILLFYMSKDERLAASQSITTLAIAEQVRDIDDPDELTKHTAKRSVYSPEEMRAMNPTPASPVKVIDFLLVGHTQPAVGLADLRRLGVLRSHPYQSITILSEDQYRALREALDLGFAF
ncbi:GNAT family N-acetyltransferase [Bradyrhizobium sp. NBAIM20]|uniref:GNAT family N-acetyltransferase n=1 Tax=unclassified Bradyrhizobium TaxID=2631580 RepID=UPI001CD77F61|nr:MULTISPECIES: GNAT family N-acetyltransferase [unclassified Bradyrhizobium]MCA1412662.1 GNAT family N-acetyltransferase [Bradyrhizobium sp. NBAIM20]MCA1463488.1 GNAT family N-acetyltransferase [Bradyrhizobium sp. NBAIM18]